MKTALLPLSVIVSSLVLAGCGSSKVDNPLGSQANSDLLRRTEALRSREEMLEKQQKALMTQKQVLDERNAQLAEREAELQAGARAAASPAVTTTPITAGSGSADNLLPPGSSPGQCFARVYSPPQYATKTEEVLKRAESKRVKVLPAKYEPGTEEVLVRAESTKLEVVPATYEWVTERVLVKPASSKLVSVPAETEQVSERIMVKAGYTTWKKGRGPIQKIDQATGEIMCLVEVPPVYKNVTKTIVKNPASTRTVDIPAEYKTVRKQVVKTPATTRQVPIPAKYKTVRVNKLVEPAREMSEVIPAEYQTVERREMVKAGGLEWREILCETNMSRDRVRDIQRALAAAGYNPGPIDGIVASGTMRAVNEYQRAKGLPVDDYLNVETVRSLGVGTN